MFSPGVKPWNALYVSWEPNELRASLLRDITSIRKPSGFYEAICGRRLGFQNSIFLEFLRVKTQECCCRAKTKLEVRPHLLLLLWRWISKDSVVVCSALGGGWYIKNSIHVEVTYVFFVLCCEFIWIDLLSLCIFIFRSYILLAESGINLNDSDAEIKDDRLSFNLKGAVRLINFKLKSDL